MGIPENAIKLSPSADLTELAIDDALAVMQREGAIADVYELLVSPSAIVYAIGIAAKINIANVGLFIKVTLEWNYGAYAWSLRCKDTHVWSPGA